MSRLIDALSCLGLFTQIFVGHSLLLLYVATIISSRSLMIILVMVLLSLFVRSLNLWRLSKLMLSSNKGRRSKWFILTKVMSITVDMMRRNATLDHLQSTFRNVALMLSIQCLVLLNKMGFRRGEIAHLLIWCDVCLLIPNYLRSYGVKL